MKNTALACAILTFIVSPTMVRAQVFEGLHTNKISAITKNHLYIENRVVGLEHSLLNQNNIRLMMLANLIDTSNAPPDFIKALKMAIKNADITIPAKNEILIVQKDLLDNERRIFNADVEIVKFNGTASGLLQGLNLPGTSIELDKTFSLGVPIIDSSKIDCKLTNFSFKGTLRDLLKELAKKRDALGGYVVMVGKNLRLSVKLIP